MVFHQGANKNKESILAFVLDVVQREQRPGTSIPDEFLDCGGQNNQIHVIEVADKPDYSQHLISSVTTLKNELLIRVSKSLS